EVYNYPLVGIFPRLWEVIPLRREEVDRRAVKMVLEVLDAGEIVLVAPEGTRSPQLQRGKEGVAYLATRSGAPVVPVAIIGSEGFPALRFSSPWSGPGAYVRFGKPFVYRDKYRRAKLDKLRKLTDEAMYQLASLLPAEKRGVYSNLTLATTDTIEWY
ncbi:lysophospholipid acyltransferase family protein, partial [Chloroflexota bacterium]